MNPQAFQFQVGTERGKGRPTSYTVNKQPYLIGWHNGKPIYSREFGLHFFTRRMKREGYVKILAKGATA